MCQKISMIYDKCSNQDTFFLCTIKIGTFNTFNFRNFIWLEKQFGICAEPNLHGSYLLFNALDHIKCFYPSCIISIYLPCLKIMRNQYSEANLTGVVAIGANYWDEFYPQTRPALLEPFPSMNSDESRSTE